ncbi:GlxA family transcriptional regulator [Polaromonas sp. P1(28)-13]|nr:GlxA family transcriptional regulator [Polaromonas sp. P1(28)-13]
MATDTSASHNISSVQRFGFLLIPDFSLIALSSAVDPLRLANMALGRRAFEWVTVGLRDEHVLSSGGIRVLPDQVMGESSRFDTVFVMGPNPLPKRGYGDTTRWLRQLADQGVTLGGIDTGSYYLAKAGLLNGYRCTIHWEDRETLVEEFPELLVSSRLFEIDRDRYTCSGGVSPLDLMTFVLRRPPGGRELAQQVSDLLVSHQRSQDENQALPMRYRYGNMPEVLLDALEMMESNVEEPLSPVEIVDYLKVSRRQLERLFEQYVRTPPSRKYLEIRLAHARLLVLRTTRRIDEIALLCGFAAPAHFIALLPRALRQHADGRTTRPFAGRARRVKLTSELSDARLWPRR